ncbi:hypothetical protein RJ640_019903 [Escallonia rubra]|uniref:Nucleolar protein 16 n=1 Tax=Escallonia rubra TaxID=112253 RepID=A0AA88RTF0_9ASTE|nr:hypothetical protein RJ640_019903 [Escallonia rubra]
MGRSRRKYKQSRTSKVRVGLPKKNPNVFKPAFCLPPKLRNLIDPLGTKWDDKGSVIENYKSFGVVSNPNLLGVRSRTSRIIESDSLQVPQRSDAPVSEFEAIDSGSDLEEDDLKSALGKKRRDGKTAPLQPLTATQRLHVRRLVEKYGDDYQSMFMDTKLNKMQHSLATLEKLCTRYRVYKDKNPLIVGI